MNDNPYEKLRRKNKVIMKTLFMATLNGDINGFYLKDDKRFRAYHRSPKENETIQLSIGFYEERELFPTCDIQLHNIEEMERKGYSSGIWEVIQ